MCVAPRVARRQRIRSSAIAGTARAQASISLALRVCLRARRPVHAVGVRQLARAGDEAQIGFEVLPHMLRHACGYALANKGIDTRTLQAYLGHRSIYSTTRYAALRRAASTGFGTLGLQPRPDCS
jgi:site-specific recombinase XerD